VAIIAILAAIAVPNFLEAQTRAKNAKCMADMRTMATALETYHVDCNAYPSDAGNGAGAGPGLPGGIWRAYRFRDRHSNPPANFTIGYELTTPIAYLTSAEILIDPYKRGKLGYYKSSTVVQGREYYFFANVVLREKARQAPYTTLKNIGGDYILWAAGPDGWCNNKPGQGEYSQANYIPRSISYDPSNGTVSNGDVHRSQKYSSGMAQDPRLTASD
jgi:type II secretory pathway pseudopilin PulG